MDSFVKTRMSFGFCGTAMLVLSCRFLSSLLASGEAVLLKQFQSYLPLFASLRMARLMGAQSSVESKYLGYEGENRELCEEVLSHLKTYYHITGRCKTLASSPRLSDLDEAPQSFATMLGQLVKIQSEVESLALLAKERFCPI